METISSLLARALGRKEGPDSRKGTPNLDSLPESIKRLVSAINGDASSREKAAKDTQSYSEKSDALRRAFSANIQELAAITAALNDAQADALKEAERRSKREEERHRRDEAARARAEKIDAIRNRRGAATNTMGVGLVGALLGRNAGDLVSNVLKATEQSRADVSELASAIYEDKVKTATERKETAFDVAAARREFVSEKAATSYQSSLEKNISELGAAITDAQKSSLILAKTAAAKEQLESAKAARDKIEAEGTARLVSLNARPVSKESPEIGPMAPVAMPAPMPQPSSPITMAAPISAPPLILSPSGGNALEEAGIVRSRQEVAERNSEAYAAVAKAGDAFAEALKKEEKSGALPAFAGATIRGEQAAASTQLAGAEMAAAIKEALAAEDIAKSGAENFARVTAGEAYSEKKQGTLVSEAEQKAIGMSNMMSMAVAPPALVIIGKVMEKFQSLFPVVEQTGNALIELGTVLPATTTASFFKLGSMLLGGFTAVKEALPGGQADVSKRYEKDTEKYAEEYGITRGEAYGTAYSSRVAEAKTRSTQIGVASSLSGLSDVGISKARANAPREYTVYDMPTTQAGVMHTATTRKEAAKEYAAPPQRYQEQSVGVVPVGASNSNVDSWR